MAKVYTEEMTARLLGVSVEELRAKYRLGGPASKLAAAAVRASAAGDSKATRSLLAERRKVLEGK